MKSRILSLQNRIVLILAFATSSFALHAQNALTVGEMDVGILASYHTLITDPTNLVFGEEYELGGYIQDMDNGGVIAVTTSYIRNGAFGTNIGLPQNNYAIGKFTSAKMRFGWLKELNSFDIFTSVGFGWITGADVADKQGAFDLLYLDAQNPVGVFSIPIGLDIQWYGFDGSINALGLKYEINGWNNYLGVGFTYLL
ncbi:MAG: hypothetical protein ACPG4S_06305 [Schleiferiaceae bacterium]|jgi:hypothetical protein|nr:MAG: Uncharacterised protein [Cryomorphaceae bacterium]